MDYQHEKRINRQTNYTVRVYAVIVNRRGEVLLTRESHLGMEFTKFPGGGMEWGEGALDTIKRELKEELHLENIELEHFYTTDFFVPSFFDSSTQVISIYYKTKEPTLKDLVKLCKEDEKLLGVKWIPLDKFSEQDVTFPIDKHVAKKIRESLNA